MNPPNFPEWVTLFVGNSGVSFTTGEFFEDTIYYMFILMYGPGDIVCSSVNAILGEFTTKQPSPIISNLHQPSTVVFCVCRKRMHPANLQVSISALHRLENQWGELREFNRAWFTVVEREYSSIPQMKGWRVGSRNQTIFWGQNIIFQKTFKWKHWHSLASKSLKCFFCLRLRDSPFFWGDPPWLDSWSWISPSATVTFFRI